jgi:guanylate kinase
MSNNILAVISGPSGSGKSTLVGRLLEEFGNFSYSVSATTRPPREGEVEGQDYFFVSENLFREMIDNNMLLEWAHVYGRHYYGTPRAFVMEKLNESNVVLDADVQGGLQIMETYPEGLFIFIQAESVDVLRERILARGEMAAEDLEARMKTAEEELSHRDRYSHVITNTDLDTAYSELKNIIQNRLDRGSDA